MLLVGVATDDKEDSAGIDCAVVIDGPACGATADAAAAVVVAMMMSTVYMIFGHLSVVFASETC